MPDETVVVSGEQETVETQDDNRFERFSQFLTKQGKATSDSNESASDNAPPVEGTSGGEVGNENPPSNESQGEVDSDQELDEILNFGEATTETKDEAKEPAKTSADTPTPALAKSDIPKDYQEIEVADGKRILVHNADFDTIKPYILRQQDYSRKTEELASEKRKTQAAYDTFQRAKEEIEQAKADVLAEKEKYIFGLPFIPKPLEVDYIDGYATQQEQHLQRQQYIKDLRAWEELQNKKAEFVQKRAKIKADTDSINDKFQKKYGEEIYNTVNKDVSKYYQAIKNDHISSPPEDILEIFYRGKNFDTLLKQELEAEKKKWVEEVKKRFKDKRNKAPEVTKGTEGNNIPPSATSGNTTQEKDLFSKRFDGFVNRLKTR